MKKTTRFFAKFARVCYSAYIGLIILIFSLFSLPTVLLSPFPASRKWAKFWCSLIFPICFCPIRVIGKENIPTDQTVIYVSNHASYLDAYILTSVLPTNIAFAAKAELKQGMLSRLLLNKLRHIFVERFDFSKSIEDAKKIQSTIQQKESVCIFPEGTFAYTSGLRPFKLGAFSIATETATPICPISLKGTRSIVRENIFLAKPNKITVTIGKLISPEEKSWDETIRIMNAARQEIAKHCGEEILNL